MKICVVGAGPCGLTTVKQLLDEGHDVVCYDKNADVGGIWLRDDRPGDPPAMKAYDNLMLTISMKLMAYSDHPFQGDRRFCSRAEYFDYLQGYAKRFDLDRCIRFGSEVTDIVRRGDIWTVTVCHDGVQTRADFDAVAVCSGPFKTPNRAIAGLENFTGEIVHSSEYRNSERFRDERVLVVGLAESGADLVREIGDVAAACTLSIRSYTFLLPRVFNRDRTTDHGTVRAHHHEMCGRTTTYPLALPSFWGASSLAKALFLTASVVYGSVATAWAALALLWRGLRGTRTPVADRNPLGEPMEPAKIDIATLDSEENWDLIREWNIRSHPDGSWGQRAIFCKNVSFIPSIAGGRVTLNDAGIDHAQGNTVHFRDGVAAEFDTIVLCTGFTQDFSIGDLRVEDGNVRNLYKHFLHPDHGGTAAFIGFVRPFSGGIPICAEMQARYFARVLSGRLHPPGELGEVIRREKAWEEHWTALSPTHTEAIPSNVLYLDALAREVGCLLPMRQLILNPKLFIQLWFGSFNPSCYRVIGPHNLGAAALADLYSEPVADRIGMARLTALRLLPASVHPKHLFGVPKRARLAGCHLGVDPTSTRATAVAAVDASR